MKPLNLREFAQSLLCGDHREFAFEIIENLDFVETSQHDELCEDIARHSEKEFQGHSPIRQIDRIGDRLNQFDEILKTLKEIKPIAQHRGDPDDIVRDLAEMSLALRNVLGLDPDGDIFEAVTQLIENQAKPLEYDL